MTGISKDKVLESSLASLFHALKSASLGGDAAHTELLEELNQRAIKPNARALLSFLKSNYLEETADQLWLSRLGSKIPKAGVSIVSCSMDRSENLLRSLDSWLALPVDEIVLVDWSSQENLIEQLGTSIDPRIKVVRIDGELHWILTNAFNIGLQFSTKEKLFKLDADIQVKRSFLEINDFGAGEFVRGNWEAAAGDSSSNQKYVNGSFGAFKKDLQKAGFYNEYIRKYGWDDTELYSRLTEKLQLNPKYIDSNSLEHLPQDEESRLLNQDANQRLLFGMYNPTEYYNIFNKNLCKILPPWVPGLLDDYALKKIDENYFVGERMGPPVSVHQDFLREAARSAIIELLSWDRKKVCGFAIEEPKIAELLVDTFEGGQEKIGARLVAERGPSPRTASFDNGEFSLPALLELNATADFDCFLIGVDKGIQARSIRVGREELFIVEAASERLGIIEEAFGEGVRNPPTSTGTRQSLVDMPPVLAISLYDEPNQARLDEYLFCLENNTQWFSWLVVFYEESTGVVYDQVREKLQSDESYKKVVFVGIDERPMFESMFTFMDTYFQGAAIVVANADIAFDKTILEMPPGLLDDVFMVLSRREVKGKDLSISAPILNSLNIPNTHSADAWIYRAPRRYEFRAEFGIGTFHCDSFLNNYIGKSGYRLVNPCITVNAFHVHHPDFNSSVTKEREQQEQISLAFTKETEVNGGVVPIKGVEWSTLDALNSPDTKRNLVDWKDTLFRVEVDADIGNLYPALLAMMAAWRVTKLIPEHTEVWLMLKQPFVPELGLPLLDLLRKEISLPRIRFGICESEKSEMTESLSEGHRFFRVAISDLESAMVDEWGLHIQNRFSDEPIDLWEGVCNSVVLTIETEMTESQIDEFSKGLDADESARVQYILSKIEHKGGPATAHWVDELAAIRHAEVDSAASDSEIVFVTSIYNGDQYMENYLHNVSAAAARANGKVICVDANSPGSEQQIFREFIDSNPQCEGLFDYIRLEEDPGLYECWRIAIERSDAPYITNANLDDRRSPLHTVSLIRFLEENPQYAAAASAIRPVSDSSIGWYDAASYDPWFREGFAEEVGLDSLYRKDEEGDVLSQNILHCMPVWRRNLHDAYGYFDEDQYGTSADWAFWLKCASAGEVFGLLPRVLGQYLVNPDSHNRQNDAAGDKELKIIREFIAPNQTRFTPQ